MNHATVVFSQNGQTALHHTVWREFGPREDMLTLLIKEGADVAAVDHVRLCDDIYIVLYFED